MASLVETVVGVLNTGETISPRPAWISMCMSEVEGIRLRVESELRERLRSEEDRCRLAASPDRCRDRMSKYISLSEATTRIDELLSEASRQYEDEIVGTVGELEGELSEQVLSTSGNLFSRTLVDSKESYLSSYRKHFHDWIRCLAKVICFDSASSSP
jgi:sugar-specific transcriptional regulator TrmB